MLLRGHLSLACAWLAFLGITCIYAVRYSKIPLDPYAQMFYVDSYPCFEVYREYKGKCLIAAIKKVPEDKRHKSNNWYQENKCDIQYNHRVCLIEKSCSNCSDQTREVLIAHLKQVFTSGECKSKNAPGSFDVSCSGVQAGVNALEKGSKAALNTVGNGLDTVASVAIVVVVVLIVIAIIVAILVVIIQKKGTGEASTDSSDRRGKSTTGKSKSAKSKK